MSIPFTAVILSGGSGTRLWPLSREVYPKQFLALTSQHSLLQETVLRVQDLAQAHLVVCNESHRFLVAEQLRQIGKQATIILEPTGRNTAPALTAAALLVAQAGIDPILAVMPSDHAIKNREGFCATLAEAASLAQEGFIITFGIVPTRPETGFGYLRVGQLLRGQARVLEAFVEKPDFKTASRYLASGNYLWNSGIFVLRAGLWLQLICQFRPDILTTVQKAVIEGKQDADFFRLDQEAFRCCPADSIDCAVMEKIAGKGSQTIVLPLEVGWSDLGSWPALWEVSETDQSGNLVWGDVYLKDTKNCLVRAESCFVAALGVEDLIIAETADAVLVASKGSAQKVREVAEYLKRHGRSEYLHHLKIHRPWGMIESISHGERYQVNRLTVLPGACIVTQLHHYRSEHWIVVKGIARVTRGEETFELRENQSTYIPVGVKHRLENPGKIPLELIEVQSGAYLGEDDIVRFPD